MTKTKKIEELTASECNYVCKQCFDEHKKSPCNNCPLYITEYYQKAQITGCYYVIKQIMKDYNERTITL